MAIRELISRSPVIVSPDATIVDASKEMKKEGVGSLLVMEGGSPVGIVTERDIIYAIADDLPLNAKVRDLMSTNLVSAEASTEIGDAAILMTTNKIRHLVVTDKGKVIGVISLRDVARALGLITTDLVIW
ncbi:MULTISPECIES: CBS domain-containing protein [Acidianus]|uniref:Histidine kinase n=1 Tax=Candidatus Acidianus copahuensis TaxID=1160895 RepID=A0A031LKI6_9CREN|nr:MULTISPECIES: CBS domain-containing protein [Acidianus]EZQ01729.1 histidine kinase [Candidatus Acidianus copahuensis]NON61458.1 CBS domain-containing protein [Acidianus sp. RZ1]